MTKIKECSWSLDISTTNVGTALWDENGNLLELKHLELVIDKKEIPEEDRNLYKGDVLKEYIVNYKKRIEEKHNAKITSIFVEAPLQNTPKNIKTTAKLLGFNGIACYIIYSVFGFPPTMISVYQARKIFCPEFVKVKKNKKGEIIKETLSIPTSIDKKKYIWEKVAELEPDVKWIYNTRNNNINKKSYDMSDAYAVGFAGLKVMGVL